MQSGIFMMKTKMTNWIPISWEFPKKVLDFHGPHFISHPNEAYAPKKVKFLTMNRTFKLPDGRVLY